MSVFQVKNDLKDFVIVAQVRVSNFARAYDPYLSNAKVTHFFRLEDAEAFRKFCIVHRALNRESLILKNLDL